MRSPLLVAGTVILAPMLLATQPADAQRVRADIRIGGGPVSGRVIVGDPYHRDYYDYYGYGPRVMRVNVLRSRDYFYRRDWLRKFRRDARPIVVYHDYRGGYYRDRFRPGLAEAHVYQRGGRFYRWDDDSFDGWVRDGRFDGRGDAYYGRDNAHGRDNRNQAAHRGRDDRRGRRSR